eukprot:1323155-Amorphochlora_amoeboformis.AAC.1
MGSVGPDKFRNIAEPIAEERRQKGGVWGHLVGRKRNRRFEAYRWGNKWERDEALKNFVFELFAVVVLELHSEGLGERYKVRGWGRGGVFGRDRVKGM